MYDKVFEIVFEKINTQKIPIQSSILNRAEISFRETIICHLIHINELRHIQLRNETGNTHEELICYLYAEYADYNNALHHLYQCRKAIKEHSIFEKNIHFNDNLFLQSSITPPDKIRLQIQNCASEVMSELSKTYNPHLFPAFILQMQIIFE